jgi:cytochrome c556
MNAKTRHYITTLILLATLSAPAVATPADDARIRKDHFHDLGAAFKAVTDTLRGPAPQLGAIQQAAARISKAAHDQYLWFPAGSGMQPGVKTSARPEIWSKRDDFHKAQDDFARQAELFQRVTGSANIDAIRSQARQLGASCKGCHDTFREEDD